MCWVQVFQGWKNVSAGGVKPLELTFPIALECSHTGAGQRAPKWDFYGVKSKRFGRFTDCSAILHPAADANGNPGSAALHGLEGCKVAPLTSIKFRAIYDTEYVFSLKRLHGEGG